MQTQTMKYRCPDSFCNSDLEYKPVISSPLKPTRQVIKCPECGNLHVILDGSTSGNVYVRLFKLEFVERLD